MPEGKPNKRYTPEFDIIAAVTILKEKLSYKKPKGSSLNTD